MYSSPLKNKIVGGGKALLGFAYSTYTPIIPYIHVLKTDTRFCGSKQQVGDKLNHFDLVQGSPRHSKKSTTREQPHPPPSPLPGCQRSNSPQSSGWQPCCTALATSPACWGRIQARRRDRRRQSCEAQTKEATCTYTQQMPRTDGGETGESGARTGGGVVSFPAKNNKHGSKISPANSNPTAARQQCHMEQRQATKRTPPLQSTHTQHTHTRTQAGTPKSLFSL